MARERADVSDDRSNLPAAMLVFLAATALVVATALLVAARLSEGSIVQLLLGTYTIAFAEVVLVSLTLSVGSSLDRRTMLAAIGALFVATFAATRGIGAPSAGTVWSSLGAAFRDPLLLTAGLVVVGVLTYSFALAVFTPENVADALGYHLARAAFWRQQHGIGYIAGAQDTRLDGFPTNGEIAMLFTMVTSASGRFAGLVQLGAATAALLAVYGIARRIGLEVPGALFGALLFCTLPVVALQASEALNDLIVASLVAVSAYFLLRPTRPSRLLGGLAVALLVGTKVTGFLALPGLAVLAVAARGRRRFDALGELVVASGAGAYWYVLNLVRQGDPTGGNAYQRAGLDPVAAISRIVRLALASIELPGAPGFDSLLYVAAAALLGGALLKSGRSRGHGRREALIAAGVVVAPLAAVAVGRVLVRVYLKLFDALGRADVGSLDPHRSWTKASPIFSWYGPLGLLLTVVCALVVRRAVRERRLAPVALVLVTAPMLWIVLLGAAVPYYEWNGRYTMGAFALASATWGLAYPRRGVAWGAVTVAALACGLSFVHLHDKASGIRLLEPVDERSVWAEHEWLVQGERPHMRALLRFVDGHVPDDARLAIAPTRLPGPGYRGGNLEPFPFFGDNLSRKVVFATSARQARDEGARWAILHETRGCAAGWARAFTYPGWMVLRRSDRPCRHPSRRA
jgi:hypothetical protein